MAMATAAITYTRNGLDFLPMSPLETMTAENLALALLMNPEEFSRANSERDKVVIAYKTLPDWYRANPIVHSTVHRALIFNVLQQIGKLFNTLKTKVDRWRFTVTTMKAGAAAHAVRKTGPRIRTMTETQYSGGMRAFGEGVTVDLLMLDKPEGVIELFNKLLSVYADMQNAMLRVAFQGIAFAPIGHATQAQRQNGVRRASSIYEAMCGRRNITAILNRSSDGIFEAMTLANDVFRGNRNETAKILITTPSAIQDTMRHAERRAVRAMVGVRSMHLQTRWELPKTMNGMEIMSFPRFGRRPHDVDFVDDAHPMNHRLMTGTTLLTGDLTRKKDVSEYRTYQTDIYAASSTRLDWTRYARVDVLRQLPFFAEYTPWSYIGRDAPGDPPRSVGDYDATFCETLCNLYADKDHAPFAASKVQFTQENMERALPYFRLYNKTGSTAQHFLPVYTMGNFPVWTVAHRHFERAYATLERYFRRYMTQEQIDLLNTPSSGDVAGRVAARHRFLALKRGIVANTYKAEPGLLPTKEYNERVAAIAGRDPFQRAVAQLYLDAPVCIETFEKFASNDVINLCTARMVRPCEEYMAQALIFTNGEPLGTFLYDDPTILKVEESVYKQYYEDLDMKFNIAITNHDAMYIIPSAKINACLSGKGHDFVDMRKFMSTPNTTRLNDRILEHIQAGNGSWIAAPATYNECTEEGMQAQEKVISLSGVFAPQSFAGELEMGDTLLRTRATQMFSAQMFFAALELFVYNPMDYMMPENPTHAHFIKMRYNTGLCTTGTMRMYDSATRNMVVTDGFHVLGPQLPNMRIVESGSSHVGRCADIDMREMPFKRQHMIDAY
jgi:hypothetical protein